MKERGYMSTNSVVAYLRSDGSIVSSYVHYDGYETGVGMTLLEHYNSDKRALAVSVGGYYSSLSEDLNESLEKSVHHDEPEMFDSMTEFEEYLMLNRHLEFGYIWTGGKWMVSSWTTEVIHAKPFTAEFGDAPKYESTWNGFSWLVTSFVREGRKTVERLRSYGNEYEDYADTLEETIDRYHSSSMKEIAESALAA